MGANTKIGWANHTFNPWAGCTKIKGSPSCDNCYAEADTGKKQFCEWGTDTPRRIMTTTWDNPPKWDREAAKHGIRYRVFSGSWCDIFEGRKDTREALHRFFDLIELTPNLDWLLLTKRTHNVMKLIPESWKHKLPDNVWIGATVENQEWADKRIPHLLEIPAKVRFISSEPLFSDLDLAPFLGEGPGKINWCITGGESGSNARGTDETPHWYRSLRDQCIDAGIPFFFKQWGNFRLDGEALVPIKSKNRDHKLDGRIWYQFPGGYEEILQLPEPVKKAKIKKVSLPIIQSEPVVVVETPKEVVAQDAILPLLASVRTLCLAAGLDVYATVNRGLVDLERSAESSHFVGK